MRRSFRWDKKYLYWGVTAFCVIAACILFYMALNYIYLFGTAARSLVKILSPFIWGLAITYLLIPLMRSLQSKVFEPMLTKIMGKKAKKIQKTARAFSVLVSEIVLVTIMVALVYLILPQLYSSVETIVMNSNTYINTTTSWVSRIFMDYPDIEAYVMTLLDKANTGLIDWVRTTILPELGSLVTNITAGVSYVVNAIYNIIIGMIVSVYIMGNFETFKGGVKRMMYCIFSIEAAEKIRAGIDFTNRTFMGFIKGKLLDSAIIGIICYIFCAIAKMPYALLVSVIIGFTNIIPFFGPFIGAVPSALLILLISPFKCLIFVIFVLVLQQIDGNIIGPKILGSTVGINGFWVMFAIIVGAGLFGFWGMLLGVPVFVVIYTLIDKLIERRLKRSDLPQDTASYVNIEHIDPATREIKLWGKEWTHR